MPNTNLVPMVQATAQEVLNWRYTQLLFAPVIKDVPKAFTNFANNHQKARNLIFMLVTGASFVIGIVLALLNQDFQNLLNDWYPFPQQIVALAPTFSYVIRGPISLSHAASFVSDKLFAGYFWLVYGDTEYNLERMYCEEVLLPQAQKMPLAEVAQALNITPENFVAEFKNIRQQFRKGDFATGAQAADLKELLEAFMSRDPKRIVTAYDKVKEASNPTIEKAQLQGPTALTQYRRNLDMAAPIPSTTNGAAPLNARANNNSKCLLTSCC